MCSWKAHLNLKVGVPSTGDQSLQVQEELLCGHALPSSLRPAQSWGAWDSRPLRLQEKVQVTKTREGCRWHFLNICMLAFCCIVDSSPWLRYAGACMRPLPFLHHVGGHRVEQIPCAPQEVLSIVICVCVPVYVFIFTPQGMPRSAPPSPLVTRGLFSKIVRLFLV